MMQTSNDAYLLTSLPANGHAQFQVDGFTYSIDKMNNGQWLIHEDATPLATLHQDDNGWRIGGANDFEMSTNHGTLPEALISGSKRH